MSIAKGLDLSFLSNRNKDREVKVKPKEKISKQNFTEKRLFGSKKKNIQIGKTFSKKGKKDSTKPVSGRKGVSPSEEAVDEMMSSFKKKKK